MPDTAQVLNVAPFIAALSSFFTGLFIPKFKFWISNETDFNRKLNFAKAKLIEKHSNQTKLLIDAVFNAGVETPLDSNYSQHSEDSLKIYTETHKVYKLGREGSCIYPFFLITALISLIGFGLSFIEQIRFFVFVSIVLILLAQIVILFRLYWIERFLNTYEDAF